MSAPQSRLLIAEGDQRDELLPAVDRLRAYVTDRLRERPAEVDGVLQLVREIVWRRRDTFDPSKGRPTDFVFGVTRNVITKELCRRRSLSMEFNEQATAPAIPDPLSMLVSRFDSHRWMTFVADAVGASDWNVVVALALGNEDEGSVALRSVLSARAIRSTRERVAQTAATVRSALAAADSGRAATVAVAAGCVPDVGGLRAVLPYLDDRCDDIAERLGIHPGTARSRVATARRLLDVAMRVLQSEAI